MRHRNRLSGTKDCQVKIWTLFRMLLFVLLILFSSVMPISAFAEGVSVEGGMASVATFSSLFKPRKDRLPLLTYRYTKPVSGRWSLGAVYLSSTQNFFSGYGLSAHFDSRPSHTEGGAVMPDGNREVQTVAKWLFRGTATLGAWRYSSVLDRAQKRLGENPSVPIEAQLYGFAVGASVYHFFSPSWSLSVNVNQIAGIASDFSASVSSTGLGLTWYY